MNNNEFFRGRVHRRLRNNEYRCFYCRRLYVVRRRSILRVFAGHAFNYRCSDCGQRGQHMYVYDPCGHHHCGRCLRAWFVNILNIHHHPDVPYNLNH